MAKHNKAHPELKLPKVTPLILTFALGALWCLVMYWLFVKVLDWRPLGMFLMVFTTPIVIVKILRKDLMRKYAIFGKLHHGLIFGISGPYNVHSHDNAKIIAEHRRNVGKQDKDGALFIQVDPYKLLEPRFTPSEILLKKIENAIFSWGNGADKIRLMLANWQLIIIGPATFIIGVILAIRAW